MSRFSLFSRSSSVPFDEAAEARELEEFFRQQDPVDIAAANWHTRQEQGLSATGQIELQHWLAASPEHAAAFERMCQRMAALRAIPAEDVTRARAAHASVSSRPPLQKSLTSQTDRRKKAHAPAGRWPSWGALQPQRTWIAFCCVALLAVGIGWHQWDQQHIFSDNYDVGRGQRQTVTLPDGSELAFDAETQAQVTLYRDHREVRITEGQIMFAVAPDSAKPFQVLAGPARVTVVGTRFSVRYRHAGMDAGAAKVAVEQGHVRVADAHIPQSDDESSAVDLVAGQGLTVSTDGSIGQVEAVAPSSIALWRKGLIRFENTSLGDALLELERYGPTGLVIRDPAIAAMPIGGSFQIGHPDEFAQMIAQILPVKLARSPTGKTEIVMAR